MLVDLLHLLRNLRRAPASAVAAVLTLSLTLGAGASIFAVVDAVLLTPPPFANPDELFVVGEIPIDDPAATPRAVGYGTFEAWRERAGALAALEAFDGTNLTLTGHGAPERTSATNVTPGFLTRLGVAPVLGRSFDFSDVGQPVAIVSHAFWRGKLAAEPGAIGRTVVLGGRAHTIVGILPERFFFALSACDVWRPFPVTPAAAVRQGYRVRAIARLARPLAAPAVAAALDDVSRTSLPPARAIATPITTAIAGGATGMLGVLCGAVVLAMLIAFTNLAGLLLVRTIDRRRELAVRSALGATRAEIARQLLFESAALVAIGTAGGVLIALWTTPAVARLALEQFGDIASREVAVSWRVIGAVSMAAAACALLCGLIPAVIAARGMVADVLRAGATPPPRERRLRRVFVSGEVALAFVLLVAMTLVGRSLFGVLRVNPGFDARGLLTMHVALPAGGLRQQRAGCLVLLDASDGLGAASRRTRNRDRRRDSVDRRSGTQPRQRASDRDRTRGHRSLGEPGLFRDDADPARVGKGVRSRRQRVCPAARRRQRVAGGEALPARAGDRPADSGCRRRRRRRKSSAWWAMSSIERSTMTFSRRCMCPRCRRRRTPASLSFAARGRTPMRLRPCVKKWHGSIPICPSTPSVDGANRRGLARRAGEAGAGRGVYRIRGCLRSCSARSGCSASPPTTSPAGERNSRSASRWVRIRRASSPPRSVRAR